MRLATFVASVIYAVRVDYTLAAIYADPTVGVIYVLQARRSSEPFMAEHGDCGCYLRSTIL